MECNNRKCSWNIIDRCGYPYDISINDNGYCSIADERNNNESDD